jgi:hypothetical protein
MFADRRSPETADLLTFVVSFVEKTVARGFSPIYYTHISGILSRGHLYLILSLCLFTT